jgi:recombinational DNA repair protein (RecF pathway)
MPHLDSCVECGLTEDLVGYLPSAGGAVCRDCGSGALALSPEGLRGIRTLVASPLADAHSAGMSDRGAREALALVTASYEHHGGFRLRTLSA